MIYIEIFIFSSSLLSLNISQLVVDFAPSRLTWMFSISFLLNPRFENSTIAKFELRFLPSQVWSFDPKQFSKKRGPPELQVIFWFICLYLKIILGFWDLRSTKQKTCCFCLCSFKIILESIGVKDKKPKWGYFLSTALSSSAFIIE